VVQSKLACLTAPDDMFDEAVASMFTIVADPLAELHLVVQSLSVD
jgi:hypothetical protein